MKARAVDVVFTLVLTGMVLGLQGRGRPIQPVELSVRPVRLALDTAYYEVSWTPAPCRNCAVTSYALDVLRDPDWELHVEPAVSPDTVAVLRADQDTTATFFVTAFADRGNLTSLSNPTTVTVPGSVFLGPPGPPSVVPVDTASQDTIEVAIDSVTTFPRGAVTVVRGQSVRLTPIIWAEGVARVCGLRQADTVWIVADVSPTGFVPATDPDPRLAVPACSPAPGMVVQ